MSQNAENEGPDYLDHLIEDAKATRPGFAERWEPIGIMLDLAGERVRLGLSQAEIAERMGVSRLTVLRMERDPSAAAFVRVLAYAKAVGASVTLSLGNDAPKPARGGPGRKVGKSATPL